MVFFEDHGVRERESFQFFTIENQSFPLHFHRAYELIIVNEGELFVKIDHKEYVLYKNELAFIFHNQLHEFKTNGPSQVTIVIFSPELIGDFFMKYKGFIPENNILQIANIPDLHTLKSIYHQKSFLYEICGMLVDRTRLLPVEYSTRTKLFHQILLFVDKHYSYECTLKAVSKYLQYDYVYLSKLFTAIANMTFTEYLNQYRISQACYQLKNTQHTINEIAMNCGYNNLRSFHRNFKKITNVSPKRYREIG